MEKSLQSYLKKYIVPAPGYNHMSASNLPFTKLASRTSQRQSQNQGQFASNTGGKVPYGSQYIW